MASRVMPRSRTSRAFTSPLRAAAFVGFIISALSVLYALFDIAVYLTVGHLPPGYTSLIVAVSFLGGLQLTVLGIVDGTIAMQGIEGR